jgi:hypothetical protein
LYSAIQEKIENFFIQKNVCIIFLTSLNNEPEIYLERLKKRNRISEQSITIEYLNLIIQNSNHFFCNWKGPKLILETNNYFSIYKEFIKNFLEYQIKLFEQKKEESFRLKIN